MVSVMAHVPGLPKAPLLDDPAQFVGMHVQGRLIGSYINSGGDDDREHSTRHRRFKICKAGY
jgi:hypothetical protein